MKRVVFGAVALALAVLGALLAGVSGAALAAEEPAAPLLLAQADPGAPPPRAIREAQGLLAGLGYDPGPADGSWGARTGRAFQAFLRDAGLPAMERLTPEALQAMRGVARRAGVKPAPAAPGAPSGRRAAPAPRPALPPDALHRSAQAGDIVGLEAALGAGADVDARDRQGWTALMHAVDRGYPVLAEMLIEAGANVDVRAPDGATALFMAVAHGHTEAVEMLMEAGADVSLRGHGGRTTLEAARLQYGDAEAAKRNGEPPAVIALLEARTAADVERARDEERRREEAQRRRLDDDAFARAKRMRTESGYREYLARGGRHEAEARALLAEITKPVREVGKKFRDCPDCPELVVVPSGSFMMGSAGSEVGRDDDEGPVRRVTIARSFAVGVYEVTRRQFARFVSATGRSMGGSCLTPEGGVVDSRPGRHWKSPGFRQTDEHPVVCVRWEDAKAYVGWLSWETGEEYRLLSESEWEYVARAGTRTRYWWGDAIGQSRANCDGCGSRWDGEKTAPVGSFAANRFGLHDVLGNVWEWVEDCWNGSYRGAPTDGSAWESGKCGQRVWRGGSWYNFPRNLGSASRHGFAPGLRSNFAGFRVARTFAP